VGCIKILAVTPVWYDGYAVGEYVNRQTLKQRRPTASMRPPPRLQPSIFPPLCRQCLPHKRRPPIASLRRLSTATPGTPDNTTPITAEFQKSQKRALKERHKASSSAFSFSPSSPWEVTCGLEVHAQLNTVRKLFSCTPRFPSLALISLRTI